MKKIFIATTILTLSNIVVARTWYVSTHGDDNNNGTVDQPFLTIQKGADHAQPGDTVYVMEGIYRERVAPPRGGTKQAPIVYMAESGKQVFIKGSDVYNGKRKMTGDQIITCSLSKMKFTDDFYYDNGNPFKVPVASTPWLRDGSPEGKEEIVFTLGQVFVERKMYQQFPVKAEMMNQKGSWWYNAKTNEVLIHLDDNILGNNVQIELTTRRRIFAPHLRGLGYIHVIGFIMEHCGNQYPRNFWSSKENAQSGALGIRSGHHWLIKNNVIRYAANIGIDCGTEGPDNERSAQRDYQPEEVIGNRFENNYLLDNGCAGITGLGSKEMIVKGNVVMYNNNQMYRGYKRYESAGIKFHNNIDCIIAENLVANNFTYGIWFDNKYPNARVTRNIIVNNLRSGFFLEMGDYDFGTVLVDHNVIMNNIENQIYIHDASGGLFINNLVAGTSRAKNKDGENRDSYGQAVYIRQVGARTRTYHHAFYNNIFCDNEVIYDINYPMWRSGEQRFLGNVYDAGADQNKMVINPASDIPKPMDGSALNDRVALELGVKAEEISTRGGKVEMDLTQWQKFWMLHSMHFDQDAIVFKTINATYQPKSQSVLLTLGERPELLKNYRWNGNYKYRFNLMEESFPGPFRELMSGSNNYSIYQGLPPVERGMLPPPKAFESN